MTPEKGKERKTQRPIKNEASKDEIKNKFFLNELKRTKVNLC
jgi:hypothetical protein